MKMIYSENDETGAFLLCPTMVARPLRNFFKILSMNSKILLFKTYISKNSLIFLSTIIRCSQNQAFSLVLSVFISL